MAPTFSSRAFVVYLVPLIMFPLAGWSLGVARGNIPPDDRSLVPKMSFEAVAALGVLTGDVGQPGDRRVGLAG